MPARLVLKRIPVPSLAIARDGRILFANEAFADMVGDSTATLLSMEFSQLFRSVPTDECRFRWSVSTQTSWSS